nr:Dihydrofolate reductase [uncultured bacterium]AIA15770.1 Dihydrofolate reductase [uncultured bacterium]
MKVFIIAAVTVDGFIGRSSDHLADWTGGEDKKIFVKLTKEAGVIVMGSRTFATIGRALPGRRNIVYTNTPEKITAEGVETTHESPGELIDRLAAEGHTAMAICGGTTVYNLFMDSGRVTELYLTFVPMAFGEGLRLFTTEQATHLRLADSSVLADGGLLAHYELAR